MSEQPTTPPGLGSLLNLKKPEGVTATVLAVLLGGAALAGLWVALPFLITIATNALHLALLCGGLAATYFVATDRRVRTLLYYGYRSITRAITQVFVEIDPIGIVKNHIRDLEAQREEMVKHIGNLRGQMRNLKTEIDANEKLRTASLQMVKQAQETDKKPVMVLHSRKAGRLQESNIQLTDLHKRLELLYRVLAKLHEGVDFLIQDLTDEVEQRVKQYNSIREGYSAYQAAKKAMEGNSDERELFEQAMEHMAVDTSMKIGEIEHFLDMSRGVIDSIDLKNMSYQADALNQLEEWERKTDDLLLSPTDKKLLLAAASSPATSVNLDEPVAAPTSKPRRGDEFSTFFD